MWKYTPISEREDNEDIILLQEQETEALDMSPSHTYRRSPKKSAIYMFVASYILALLAIASTGLKLSYLMGFLVVVATTFHILGFLCLAFIEEV